MKTPRKTSGPKPRTVPRAATKVCEAGHKVGDRWRPGDFCGPCYQAKHLADQAEAARLERIGWQAGIGPIPDSLVMRAGTGEVITCSIPKHLRAIRKRRRR